MDALCGASRIFAGDEMGKLATVKYRRDIDSREQPLYSIPEAAQYLGVHSMTLHTWFYGRHYRTKTEGIKFWKRVIVPADEELQLLSFYNLAEAHILAATRYIHRVPFPAVRGAIANLTERFPKSFHPLLSEDFYTDGVNLFIKTIEETIDVSREQLTLKYVMDMFLQRVIRDNEKNPFKVFPVVPGVEQEVVSVTFKVSSSRPIIDGTGVRVAVILGRHNAGESAESIAEDFDIPVEKVKVAIDYAEWKQRAA